MSAIDAPGDPAKLPRLGFVHVPKTAGTSVRSYLFDLYGASAYRGLTTLDYHATTDAELARYRFHAGHAYRHDWTRLPAGTRFITILRDPVERAISLYRYWNVIDITPFEVDPVQNQPIIEAVHTARTRRIDEFVMSTNGAIMEHVRGAFARQLVTEDMLRATMLGGPKAIDAFELAVETLFAFDAVLTTERLDQTFPRAMAELGLGSGPARLGHENASRVRLHCDRDWLQQIMRLVSPMDFQLYAVARQLETRFLR